MNRIKAIAVSLVITAVIGCGMLAIGWSALFNPNGVAPSNSPGAASVPVVEAASTTTDVKQLQDLVRQYQQREQQYQQQLNTAANRLNQANQQLQSYQQLISALQQAGVIQISANGQVYIPQQRFGGDDNFFGGGN